MAFGKARIEHVSTSANYVWLWEADGKGHTTGTAANVGSAIDAVKPLAVALMPIGGRIQWVKIEVGYTDPA